jgi:hypothetical protein
MGRKGFLLSRIGIALVCLLCLFSTVFSVVQASRISKLEDVVRELQSAVTVSPRPAS